MRASINRRRLRSVSGAIVGFRSYFFVASIDFQVRSRSHPFRIFWESSYMINESAMRDGIIGFSDGNWVVSSDPDFQIHRLIDSDLRSYPNERFPALSAVPREEKMAWLRPVLERLRHELSSESNSTALRGMVGETLPSLSQPAVPFPLLPPLVELGPLLQRNTGEDDCHNLNDHVAHTLAVHKGPVDLNLAAGLRRFVHHLIACHAHGTATFDIAWRLWQDPGVDDGPPHGFATVVRRSLRSLSEEERQAWDRLWATRGKNRDPHNFIGLPYRKILADAVAEIGHERFAARFQEWISRVSTEASVTMTAACREILLLMLYACRAVPSLPVDDSLRSLSAIRWAGEGNARLQKEWLGELLEALAVRPPDRGLAAAEALMANPTTNRFVQVRLCYDWLAADVQGTLPDLEYGIDGYPIRKRPEHRLHHLTLDRHMRAHTPVACDRSGAPVESVWRSRELAKLLTMRRIASEPATYCEAIADRTEWLTKTRKKPETQTVQVGILTFEESTPDLYGSWLYALTELEEELAAVPGHALAGDSIVHLVRSVSRSQSPISDQTFDLVRSHIAEHGFSLELVEAMRRWHGSLRGGRAMALRRRLEWLLWFEDVDAVSLGQCWSERIRADLRAMPAHRRAPWRALFETATAGLGPKPTKKWWHSAPKLYKKIGADDFRNRFRQWFTPFRESEPQRLTVGGRDALRLLIFASLAASDPQVDEALGWLAGAKWRTRRDGDRFATAVPAFLCTLAARSPEVAHRVCEDILAQNRPLSRQGDQTYESVCAIQGVEPMSGPALLEPPGREEVLLKFAARFLNGPHSKVEGNEVIVTGNRDIYAISLQDSTIVRRSDGRKITIAPEALKEFLRPFQSIPNIAFGTSGRGLIEFKLIAQILALDDVHSASILAESVH